MGRQIGEKRMQERHECKIPKRYDILVFNIVNSSERHTLQSNANLLASMIAAFLSLSDSKANTNESPCFGCQNSACAAAFPPPRTPQSWRKQEKNTTTKCITTNKRRKDKYQNLEHKTAVISHSEVSFIL